MTSKPPDGESPRPRRRKKTAKNSSNAILIGALAVAVLVLVGVGVGIAVHFVKSRTPATSAPPEATSTGVRLVGTWRSDADATIAEIRKSRTVTDSQEQAFRKLFGKMRITYTDKTLTTDMNGIKETQPYQVVSKDATAVVLKSWSALNKRDEETRLRFTDNNTYWIDSEQFKLSECFRRVE